MVRVSELADYVPVATAKAFATEDEAMQAKVARKRAEEAERRHRIFDAKRRTIGIDKAALDEQVEEKKMMEDVEKERNANFDQQAAYFNNVIKMQELEARQKRQELERQVKMYSLLHNNKAERTNADLENPPLSHPPLSPLAEPCSIASAQVFAGEDMGREARIMAQKQQLRDWYEQQVFEKNMAAELVRGSDDIFTTQNNLAAQNLLQVEQAETAMRAELEHSRQQYNQFMESSKRYQKFEEKERVQIEQQAHVDAQLTSDFLNESTNHIGNGKILFTEYKGEPKGGDALDHMIMSREAQIEQKAVVEAAKVKEEKAYVRQQEMVRRTLVENQMKEKRMKREMQEQVVRENMAIAAGRKAKDAYAQHSMYTNECSDLFWTQFGTSTR
jgi:hypothetical protein